MKELSKVNGYAGSVLFLFLFFFFVIEIGSFISGSRKCVLFLNKLISWWILLSMKGNG